MSEVDLVFLIVILVVGVFTSKLATKKKADFKESADKFISAYGFKRVTSISSELHRHGFSIFDLDEDGLLENILLKTNASSDVYLFDFQYSIKDGGRSSQSATQRVAFIKLNNDLLYSFDLKPESYFDKIKQAIGFEDIDFDDFKKFSNKYALKSSDKERVEKSFPQKLMKMLEEKEGVFIEARKNCILIYIKGGHELSAYEPLYNDAVAYKKLLIESV
ncbi:hypothetical protein E2K93_11255 [Thalassotalea sp. HSM 43]|uniref:hypothetical protein n=1 Tax=Thalassotalea sp. HSM 43 TaxID=2552945 RepID=UPI00108098BB|nr:hypothetical protein [Thalassotalea sp. HSM 43]QBY04924.1 hypothetical protein E2K93_11255 [Thalassotalea sp. HSM 43]